MSTTGGEIPSHSTPTNQPIKRHHRPHYHVRHVRESLSERFSKFLCATFLILLLVSGIFVFILWLSLRPHRPRFHISSFSFPALAQDNGFENAQITFNFTIRNPNQKIGVYYDSMKGTVYYRDERIGGSPLPLPSPYLPYYQEPKDTIWIQGQLGAPTTLGITHQRWMEFMEDRATGTVSFRLELVSKIRFKVKMWDSRWHWMHANCQVAVGQDGLILPVFELKRCPLFFT